MLRAFIPTVVIFCGLLSSPNTGAVTFRGRTGARLCITCSRLLALLKGTGMLNETLEDSITSRQAAWATGLQERNRAQFRVGVNH